MKSSKRQQRVSVFGVLTLLIVMSGCCAEYTGPMGTPRVTALLGGPEGYELFAIPALAGEKQVYRVVSAFRATDKTKPTIGEAFITGGPVAITDDEALRQFSAVLTDDAAYIWEVGKNCEFDPGVAIRFVGAKTTVDVLFCFSCSELVVYRDGKPVGSGYFDDRRGDFVAIVKKLLPDDPEIQKL